MKVRNYMQIPLFYGENNRDKQLNELVKLSLVAAGFDVIGGTENWNAHQVFVKMRENDEVVAFAGMIRLNSKTGDLEIVGDMEYNLDETTTSQIAHASPGFIRSLTTELKFVNTDFRAKSIANSKFIGRGTAVTVDEAAQRVAADKTVLSTIVVTDGQKGIAATADDYEPTGNRNEAALNGRMMLYPRKFKEFMTAKQGLICINNSTIPNATDCMAATQLAIRDLSIASNDKLTGNLIHGVKQSRKDGDTLIIYQGGRLAGSVSGASVDAAIDMMSAHNAMNGHGKEVLMPNGRPAVVIDPVLLDRAIEQRESLARESESIAAI